MLPGLLDIAERARDLGLFVPIWTCLAVSTPGSARRGLLEQDAGLPSCFRCCNQLLGTRSVQVCKLLFTPQDMTGGMELKLLHSLRECQRRYSTLYVVCRVTVVSAVLCHLVIDWAGSSDADW